MDARNKDAIISKILTSYEEMKKLVDE